MSDEKIAVSAIPSYLTVGALERDEDRIRYEGVARNDQSGALERDKRRITYEPFVYSDINTNPILGKPLSRNKLQALLHELLALVAQLPDDSFKNQYGL